MPPTCFLGQPLKLYIVSLKCIHSFILHTVSIDCKWHLHTYRKQGAWIILGKICDQNWREMPLLNICEIKCYFYFIFFIIRLRQREMAWNVSKWDIVWYIHFSCITCFSVFLWFGPWFPSFTAQFSAVRAASSNKNCLLLNSVRCCWPSDPFLFPHMHLLLCLHLKFSHPTTFMTSWSVVFFLLLSNPCCQMGCSVV